MAATSWLLHLVIVWKRLKQIQAYYPITQAKGEFADNGVDASIGTVCKDTYVQSLCCAPGTTLGTCVWEGNGVGMVCLSTFLAFFLVARQSRAFRHVCRAIAAFLPAPNPTKAWYLIEFDDYVKSINRMSNNSTSFQFRREKKRRLRLETK